MGKRILHFKKVTSITFLVVVFAFSLTFFACSPQEKTNGPNQVSKTDQSVEFSWTADSDCGMCHEKDVTSFTNSSCLASKHSALSGKCATCHSDEKGLVAAHEKVVAGDVKKNTKLKKTEVPSETCLSCHVRTEIVESTVDSTVLTDKNGVVVNPHALTPSESHDKITCSYCHKTHGAEPLEDTAKKTCTNCHHDNVYQCGTCHD